MAAGAALPSASASGAELLPGVARHAAVQGEAPGPGHGEPLPGVLAAGPRAAVRPLAAAQLHRSGGPKPSLTPRRARRTQDVE